MGLDCTFETIQYASTLFSSNRLFLTAKSVKKSFKKSPFFLSFSKPILVIHLKSQFEEESPINFPLVTQAREVIILRN
jgi:hypothetical protein